MKKGIEIVPEDQYRLKNEDMFEQDAKFGSKGAQHNSSTQSTASTKSSS